jgi:peptidoglycan glycosyltransferase
VNRQISRLFVAFATGFALLVAFTSYWQLWAAPSLANRRDNLRQEVRQLSIKRGLILAGNGDVLARNRLAHTPDGRKVYLRVYPTGRLFAHAVGYSSPTANRTGLEQSQNDYLTGANTDLSGFLQNELSSVTGTTAAGNNVQASLEPAVQQAAMNGLRATHLRGAAVAIEPSTGRVLALASIPSFDPNHAVADDAAWRRILTSKDAPLLDRATAGLFEPGSTFKVVTLSAALETGAYTPTSTFDDKGFFTEYGQQIRNASGEVFGPVDLTKALTNSINSVFATIGYHLCGGRSRCPVLINQMLKYGFYSRPPIDLPTDEVLPSGLFNPRTGRLARPTDPIDPARTAIGQYTLRATPLQNAMVAAAIGNGGVIMQPTLVDAIRTPGGHTIATTRPDALGSAVSPQTAAEITQMMTHVVEEGTGRAAAIPGVTIAGKTGTAETGITTLNRAWFIAFAPAQNPRVAVSVVLENSPTFGGVVAAPIAKAMMQAALRLPKRGA